METGASGFQRTVREGTETLDSLSRLFLAINTRRATEARPAETTPRYFTDVSKSDSAYSEMSTLYDHHVLLGYPAATIRGLRDLASLHQARPSRLGAGHGPVSRRQNSAHKAIAIAIFQGQTT